jgi:hypothetical protein
MRWLEKRGARHENRIEALSTLRKQDYDARVAPVVGSGLVAEALHELGATIAQAADIQTQVALCGITMHFARGLPEPTRDKLLEKLGAFLEEPAEPEAPSES